MAGCEQIAVCMPPSPTGAYNREMLATCHELGVGEVYRLGGAQAIAAMAYGVEGIKPVDMIVGPGNQYVALAKKRLRTSRDRLHRGSQRDRCPGRRSRTPITSRLDLIAQAEHSQRRDPRDLVRTAHRRGVPGAPERLAKLSRADLARDSLERSALVLAPSKAAAAMREHARR